MYDGINCYTLPMKWSNVTHLTHVKLPYAISWAYLSTVENLILDLNPTRYPIFCNISSSKLSNLKRSTTFNATHTGELVALAQDSTLCHATVYRKLDGTFPRSL
jgi:hypothetical protein